MENDAADGNPQRARIPTAAWKSLRLSHISHRPDGGGYLQRSIILTAAIHLRNADFLSEGWGVPQWLAWKAFYDSLDFYGKRTPKQDVQIVTEKFGLMEAQASSLLSAGQSFLAEIQRIDQDARVEAKKRYQYVTPQTGPPPAGGPTRRASAQPKTIYERAQADGLYAEVEAKKQAALTKHINSIRLSLSSAKMDQISQFVETSVKPQISRYAGPKPTAKGQPRPGTGLTESPLKVR